MPSVARQQRRTRSRNVRHRRKVRYVRTCSICYEPTTAPLLSCQHLVCVECFEREVVYRRVDCDPPLAVLCPVCRAVIPIARWESIVAQHGDNIRVGVMEDNVPVARGWTFGGPDASLGDFEHIHAGGFHKLGKSLRIWFHRLTLAFRVSSRLQALARRPFFQLIAERGFDPDPDAVYDQHLSSFELNEMRVACTARPCPCCNVYIERDTGCAHMSCILCQTQFCWNCQNPSVSIFGCKECRFSRYSQLFPLDVVVVALVTLMTLLLILQFYGVLVPLMNSLAHIATLAFVKSAFWVLWGAVFGYNIDVLAAWCGPWVGVIRFAVLTLIASVTRQPYRSLCWICRKVDAAVYRCRHGHDHWPS
jgi:hypothetical protein